MKHILDAIQAGETCPEDFGPLPLPESYRAVTVVHKDEVGMFEGLPSKDKDPAQVAARRRRAPARARPGRGAGRRDGQRHQLQHRVDLDLRAGLHLRVPRALRPHLRAHQAPRPALPRRGLRPLRRGARDRPRRAPAGSPATASWPTASRSSWRIPDGHNDTMLDPEQRIWGFETNFGGLAEVALVKANQLMPKPEHLTWEEAASPGLVNSTAYRQLVCQQRRRHEAGRQRAHLGRLGRPRRLRDAVRPQRRRDPRLRGLQRGEGRRSAAAWARS